MMRKLMGLLAGIVVVGFASQALALGTSFGVRLGYGPSFPSGDKAFEDVEASSFVAGPGVKLDLLVAAIEIDLLYAQTKFDFSGVDVESTDISVPVIGKLSFPLIPVLLDLNVGLGLEPRFHLSTTVDGKDADPDNTEDMVLYLPVTLGADVNLGVATVGAELRYLYQLTETESGSDNKVHHLLFMAGAWF